jgi:hypothetical protein
MYCILQILSTVIWSSNKFNFMSVFLKLLLIFFTCFITSYLLKEKNHKSRKHRKIRR